MVQPLRASKPLKVAEIPIRHIEEGKYGIRKDYKPEEMQDLVNSIKQRGGTIQPVLVQPMPGQKYQLVAGSRRLRAVRRAGKDTITAMIMSGLDDVEALTLALTENLQREDLTPFEEGWAILKLVKNYHLEPKDVAREIGKPLTFVTSRMQLLGAGRELQEMYTKDQIGLGHIEALAAIPSPEVQLRWAKTAVKEKLSGGELVTLLREENVRKVQDRTTGTVLTSKKVSLRVKQFNEYLKLTIPKLQKSMAYGEAMNVNVSLRSLKETIEKLMKELEG